MIPKGLFTQIGMVIVAVAIVITYVQPEFAKIAEVQDSIEVFEKERAKVESVNTKLAALTSKMNSVSNDNKSSLRTYMPDKIDEIAIRRDLLLITEESGALYEDSSYIDGSSPNSNRRNRTVATVAEGLPAPHVFTLSVEGTYGQMKELFQLLSQNNYPLEVHAVNISQEDGGFLTAEITLTTYSYKMKDVSQ